MLLGENTVLEVIVDHVLVVLGKITSGAQKSPRMLRWMGRFLQLRLKEE